MDKTLVIVDMQSQFTSSNIIKIKNAVGYEIQKFKAKRNPIIFLEYAYCEDSPINRTHKELLRLISNYNLKKFRTKTGDSGAEQVLEECELNNWPFTFDICGVNLCHCVAATTRCLCQSQKVNSIRVLLDACCCNSSFPEGFTIQELKNHYFNFNKCEVVGSNIHIRNAQGSLSII